MSNLDEALERFLLVDFEYAGGFANHGPMAVVALEDLGHQALIPAFVDCYAPRLAPFRPGRALAPAERADARGDATRAADWTATFEAALAGEGAAWREVALAAVRALLPGLFAAAGHGLLRSVHAMRALERADDPVRRRELARGLAYWSASFRPLPGEPGSQTAAPSSSARVAPSDALPAWLAGVPKLGLEAAQLESFDARARRLAALPGFRTTIERLALPAAEEVDGFLAALSREAARLYLAHADHRIAYVHAVTVPSAVRWLVPRLAPEDGRWAAGFAAQAVAALHAMFGASPAREGVDEEVERTARNWDEIRYRAACSLEEHAIKLAEACLREDRLGPDPCYRLAAADAALRLVGSPNAGR